MKNIVWEASSIWILSSGSNYRAAFVYKKNRIDKEFFFSALDAFNLLLLIELHFQLLYLQQCYMIWTTQNEMIFCSMTAVSVSGWLKIKGFNVTLSLLFYIACVAVLVYILSFLFLSVFPNGNGKFWNVTSCRHPSQCLRERLFGL